MDTEKAKQQEYDATKRIVDNIELYIANIKDRLKDIGDKTPVGSYSTRNYMAKERIKSICQTIIDDINLYTATVESIKLFDEYLEKSLK